MTWTAVCYAYTVHVNSLHGTLMQSTLIITSNWIAALYELAHAEMAYSPRSLVIGSLLGTLQLPMAAKGVLWPFSGLLSLMQICISCQATQSLLPSSYVSSNSRAATFCNRPACQNG